MQPYGAFNAYPGATVPLNAYQPGVGAQGMQQFGNQPRMSNAMQPAPTALYGGGMQPQNAVGGAYTGGLTGGYAGNLQPQLQPYPGQGGFQFYPTPAPQVAPQQYPGVSPSAVPPQPPSPQKDAYYGNQPQQYQPQPQPQPQPQQQLNPSGGYDVGDQIEVWSKSLNAWCPGIVERLEGPMVHVKFRAPEGNYLTKAVPDGHNELRLVRKAGGPTPPSNQGRRSSNTESNIGVTSGVPPPAKVLVDTEEDIVEVQKKVCRIGRLSMGAVHGMNPIGTLSRNDHAGGGIEHMNFQYQPHASSVANDIVDEAMHMANYIMNQERGDVLDKEWPGPGGQDALLTVFKTGDRTAVATAFERLAGEVEQILARQPSLVRASVPCKVFGDVHGQFRDFLLLLHNYGFPAANGPMYIFNGDWADRGAHQLEVIALVFALKALFPEKVWLLRGNHEDAVQNQNMGPAGLDKECSRKLQHYGGRVFEAIHGAFNWLPLGCVISNQILVVHGGIGDGEWSLDYLQNLPPHCCRPLDHDKIPRDKTIYNVLWSDPIPDDGDTRPDIIGVHDSPRDGHAHMIVTFGRDVTERFCARNNLEMIIRSHQAIAKGYGYDVMHGGRCVRVFSARDYEGSGNDGCVLYIVEKHGHLLVRPQVVRSLMCPKTDG